MNSSDFLQPFCIVHLPPAPLYTHTESQYPAMAIPMRSGSGPPPNDEELFTTAPSIPIQAVIPSTCWPWLSPCGHQRQRQPFEISDNYLSSPCLRLLFWLKSPVALPQCMLMGFDHELLAPLPSAGLTASFLGRCTDRAAPRVSGSRINNSDPGSIRGGSHAKLNFLTW